MLIRDNWENEFDDDVNLVVFNKFYEIFVFIFMFVICIIDMINIYYNNN